VVIPCHHAAYLSLIGALSAGSVLSLSYNSTPLPLCLLKSRVGSLYALNVSPALFFILFFTQTLLQRWRVRDRRRGGGVTPALAALLIRSGQYREKITTTKGMNEWMDGWYGMHRG